MRVAFLADARSPIAQNWIKHFIASGQEVFVISSYPCSPDLLPGATLLTVPFGFSQLSKIGHNGTVGASKGRNPVSGLLATLRSSPATEGLRILVKEGLVPLELYRHIGTLRRVVAKIVPDLVHAMRIPFEGILAAQAIAPEIPLLLSVWGNDFTLFAARNPLIAYQTRQSLQRTNLLHCDCRRDLNLAYKLGFSQAKPALVAPSGGGVQTEIFYPGPTDSKLRQELRIPPGASVVINPRGFRSYVNNKGFFEALPSVLQKRPETVVLCNAMQGNTVAEGWVKHFGLTKQVRLLPLVSRAGMAELFRLADVTVSPSYHDGTPNTLLEAMACGCFPVAGRLESVEEWISDGVNGLLCDPNNPRAIAGAILQALDAPDLRSRARQHNVQLIGEKAAYGKVMQRVEEFYASTVRQAGVVAI